MLHEQKRNVWALEEEAVVVRTTLRDVAERSGFSITTVSHVLNDVPGKRIPDSTRDRVRTAAAELAYTPNRLAQGLRLQRSDTIGFVNDQIATSPHAGLTILGAQDAAAEYGSLLLMMTSGNDPDLESREIRALLDRQVDGIVYAAEYHRLVTPPAVLRAAPAVLLDAGRPRRVRPYVVPDEFGGADDGGEGADRSRPPPDRVRQQHRRHPRRRRLRLRGVQEALSTTASPAVSPGIGGGGRLGGPGGYRAASAVVDRPAESRPTAMFCFNDRMAMGAYQAAAALGLRIPEDLSIVGFDDQQIISASLRPGLTTVALPHWKWGEWAVHALMRLIHSDGQATGRTGRPAVPAGAPCISGPAAPCLKPDGELHPPDRPLSRAISRSGNSGRNELEDSVVTHTLKRLAAVSLAAALALSLAACGKGGS